MAAQPRCWLFFIHGDYERALDKADQHFMAPALQTAGAWVAVANYALCPSVSIEHRVLQATQLLRSVFCMAAARCGDRALAAVVDHSAGGYPVTVLLICRRRALDPDLPAQALTHALSISGLVDPGPLPAVASLQPGLQP